MFAHEPTTPVFLQHQGTSRTKEAQPGGAEEAQLGGAEVQHQQQGLQPGLETQSWGGSTGTSPGFPDSGHGPRKAPSNMLSWPRRATL